MNILEKTDAEITYLTDKIVYDASVYQESDSNLYVLFFRVKENTVGDEAMFLFRNTPVTNISGTSELEEYLGTAGVSSIQYYPRLPLTASKIGRGLAVKLRLQSYDEAVQGMDTIEQDFFEYLRTAVGFRDEAVVTTYTFSE